MRERKGKVGRVVMGEAGRQRWLVRRWEVRYARNDGHPR